MHPWPFESVGFSFLSKGYHIFKDYILFDLFQKILKGVIPCINLEDQN